MKTMLTQNFGGTTKSIKVIFRKVKNTTLSSESPEVRVRTPLKPKPHCYSTHVVSLISATKSLSHCHQMGHFLEKKTIYTLSPSSSIQRWSVQRFVQGLRSSCHQRNRHQEVDSPLTNNSEIIDTV